MIPLGLLTLAATPALAQQASAPAVTTRPALTRPQVEKLVNQLIQPQFRIREQATKALCEVSNDTLSTLVAVYRDERRLELKLRLRYVIETVFFRRLLEGRVGFLGVGPRIENGVVDLATGKAGDVVLVARVLPGFPAERAGLRAGDMIAEFDGKSIADVIAVPRQQVRAQAVQPNAGMGRGPAMGVLQGRIADARITAFTTEVARREPGTAVPVRLLRCSAQSRLLAVPVPQEKNRSLEGATFATTLAPDMNEKANPLAGPSVRPALLVAGVAANSAAANAGLQAGDVVLGTQQSLNAPGGLAEQIATEFAAAAPGSRVMLRVSHVDQVRLTVTLGGRPVDRMNEDDMIIAQNRFADWWRSETGELSLRNTNPAGIPLPLPRPPTALPGPTVLP